MVVGEDGRVLSFGKNYSGQLGTGNNMARITPTRVAGLPGAVRQVAAGSDHTGIVTEAGDLFMCGEGYFGQLGLGDHNKQATPTLVERAIFDGEAVLMVACGFSHTVVATQGGGVYTFGSGWDGRLGHGDEEDQLTPRLVPAAAFNGERIVMVAAGKLHTVALSEAGHVFTWGSDGDGQLGHNDQYTQRVPRQVEPGCFGGDKVVFVAAGSEHTVAVTAEGRLYTWGRNDGGQLGNGRRAVRRVPRVVSMESFLGSAVVMATCGYEHTLVVTEDGGLWTCGNGSFARLGLNDVADRLAFERVGGTTGVAFGGARVMAAAAGWSNSAAVTEDGALWTWGRGRNGQLGHGDEEYRLVPTRVPAASLQDTRIGRCRPLPTDHALALAMGTHGRLGAASPVRALAGEPGLLTMIASAASHWVSGVAGESEGLIRLLGGVSVDRQRRYAQTTQA